MPTKLPEHFGLPLVEEAEKAEAEVDRLKRVVVRARQDRRVSIAAMLRAKLELWSVRRQLKRIRKRYK